VPPARPPVPTPEPGSIAELDARTGGYPMLIFVNDSPREVAYLFRYFNSPYISVGAFNSAFDRNIYWTPVDGGGVRIYTGERVFFTNDYDVAGTRLWLRMTPALQTALGVRLVAVHEDEIYFVDR